MNKKEIAAEIYRKYFEIVPKGHHNCQLSIINCQFTKYSFCREKPIRIYFNVPHPMRGVKGRRGHLTVWGGQISP